MLTLIIQFSLISFALIFLIHQILLFFKKALTVPKIKDLVNSPNQKYKDIFETISNSKGSTDIDALPTSIESPTEEPNEMKNELKSFLKKQLKGDEITSFDSDSFANFSAF